ncbi:hypothetical protein HG535_0F02310 [Zygotorulaspora mrakii]|uniref:Uncharacterized protein n=1 Tax=Zygotorulaspora mrakii TaxID=42260 RepID=A0A7H9B563_ZYGMR|nr:uncharacterized protein HG535_0F02310 [Zygotorulaspora mrakii]QLG73720.1 hypothetical protein HG535_0F02310 [Zygotorulaspora mrakii]
MLRQAYIWNKALHASKQGPQGSQKVSVKRLYSNGKRSKKGNNLSSDLKEQEDLKNRVNDETQKSVTGKAYERVEASEKGDNGTVQVSSIRKSILVPKVPSTDYIPTRDVQTEGLYAGYRPLFLGNSPVRADRRYNALDNFFSSFANLKVAEDTKGSGAVSVSETIEDLKRNNTDDNLQNSSGRNRKPIIPWDASISGMVYDDQAFKDVPKNVMSRLKPFKIVRVERNSDKKRQEKYTDLIKMKVHNSAMNDDSEIVNISRVAHVGQRNHIWDNDRSDSKNQAAMNARKNYQRESSDYAYKHKFIKSDQRTFKTDVEKINRLLAKEFYKQTGLTIKSELLKNQLPLYIYVDKSISAKILFRRFLKKRIIEDIEPVLATLLSSYDTRDQAERFQQKINLRINNIIRSLSEHLPSVYFTSKSVDCILHSSPISGFKRINWLKPHKRRCIFWGKNIEMDYFFHLNHEYNVSRGGVKYMRYPVNLHWKNFDGAFSEWDYFA